MSNIILINIITHIINVSLFTNLKKYGIFIPVIILEFVIYMIINLIIILLLLLSYFGIITINNDHILYTPQIAVHVDNIEIVVANIPQIAVRIDNIEIEENIPQALPVNLIFNITH